MESLLFYLLEFGIFAAGALYLYSQYLNPFDYWKKRGIPYIKPQYPLIGTVNTLTESIVDVAKKWYADHPNEKFYGTFTLWRPSLIVKDPELVESILIKDFSHAYNRNNVVDIETNILSKHLVNYHDEKWKALRNKLTPTFTSGKLKGMHPQLLSCAQSMVKYLSQNGNELEIKDICGRYSMDVVASVAFGLDLDVMNKPDNEFYDIGKKTFAPNYFIKCFFLLQAFLAPIYKKFGLAIIPTKLMKFFVNAVDETLKYREDNNVVRPDFLHLMNELKKRDDELVKNKELDPNDPTVFDHASLISNAFVFFAAGYETTATTLSYLFYELAMNPDTQEKLYQEIVSVMEKHDGELTFEGVAEMNYMEQVVCETLRKRPPGVGLDRKITKDYQLPGTDIVLPAGLPIMVAVYGLHHDPQYFPEPDKFIPERFDPEKNSITKGSYLPFGLGPRMCIAARFARTEIKVCAAMVIKNFRVVKCSKTKIPLEYDHRSFLLTPKGGVWLSFEKRDA